MPDTPDLTRWNAVDLAAAIRARDVSCVDVMTATLDRIERINPVVNAIVSLQPRDDLLAQAARKDAELAAALADGRAVGPLHGFPQAPKDLAATAGIVTTQGSPMFARFVPTTDAIVVERARRAGAILIGKTNTPEFGLGSHTYNPVFGTTRNAYDPTKSAGGSSGGAAVALATGMLPVADGSDMMGSLRNPAGWNGVFGFRPSIGRVPYGPTNELYLHQLGTAGPMGRTVADVALLLSVQAGHDARAPLSLDGDPSVFARPLAHDVAGARIGWLGDFDGHLPMEDGVIATCTAALAAFDALGCVVDVARPDFSMDRLWDAWLVLRAFLVAGNLGVPYADPKLRAMLKPEARWEVERGNGLTAAAVHRASVDRSSWYQALAALFERFDYPRAADGAGVSVRREPRLAEADRRSRDGHVPPLDGGRDRAHDGRTAGARGAGRLRTRRAADRPADHRPPARRPRRAAARACVRSGGAGRVAAESVVRRLGVRARRHAREPATVRRRRRRDERRSFIDAHRRRGSSASRRPSPSRLNDSTSRKIDRPGQIAIHGALSMKSFAVFSMLPQLGAGGCWPRPRNDRLASAMIAAAIASVDCTISGDATFGSTCRTAMRHGGLPTARAAST